MLEREAMAALVSVQGLSYGRREMALRAAGSAEGILADPMAFAAQLTPAGAQAVRDFVRDGGAERTLRELEQRSVHLLLRGEAGYPPGLMQSPRPPHLLFAWGEARLDDAFPFAVVGTRRATQYGLSMTCEIARDLAAAGVCVVSGLAMGVDAQAHRGALEAKGRTAAVLGSGLDRLSPARNRRLMYDILENGGSVVTEYPLGMPAAAYTFLHRNRIIAGMCLGVLVTEGEEKSGALRTAEDALACGREVFALPGDVRSKTSQLPHMLIRDGAHLTTCAQDILNMIRIEHPAQNAIAWEATQQSAAQKAPPAGMDEEQSAVWRALDGGERSFDELCEATGIDADTLSAALMMLELDGAVEALPGLRWRPV